MHAKRWLPGLLFFAGLAAACWGERGPVRPAPAPHAVASALPSPTPARAPAADEFASLTQPIEEAIAEKKLPGCVVVVGRREEVLLTRAYGSRSILPEATPMTTDTVFDLASLTKPIATATSIMILVERGLVSLDAPASRYVPELATLPPFTVRQLLLHESGLVADTALDDYTRGPAEAMKRIAAHRMAAQPGERFIYSDVGFIVLGEIVHRVSGQDLATFAAREIFAPLGMTETGFLPPADLRKRAAPTEWRDAGAGGWMLGDVHDPRAWALGGVAGHAGVFSTATDLAQFARAMLGRGALDGHRIFSPATADLFFAREPSGRTLGWDAASPYAKHFAPVFSPHAFGHGGFTGTALWVDPDKDLFIVFLSNRVHPDGTGQVNPLIGDIAELAVQATQVTPGIDVLRAEGFERLHGLRVGLLTNTSARGRDGTTTLDAFQTAGDPKLAALFSPEHGLAVDHDGKVADSDHAGVPVYSLYGDRFAPPPEVLAGLDALVVDLQDVGVRFYTYASTMRRAMRVASDRGMRFVVLDRPNPLDGVHVEGPVFSGKESFVNSAALPVRHGMTMGELARLFAAEDHTAAKLEVVQMRGWHRSEYFDATGLPWVSPSPNLRSLTEALLYPALGLVEGTNVSVGRGTDAPFEQLGAPWIDGDALARSLEAAKLGGVAFSPTTFTPTASVYRGETCHGVRVALVDRAQLDPMATGMTIASALWSAYPGVWKLDKMGGLLGSDATLDAIRRHQPLPVITGVWADDLAAFRTKRAAFLLY